MACSKYTLTNTGSTIVNFNYQRCDDAMWEYQVELAPNQTKNIWLLDTTYSTAFPTSIVQVDLGVFPPPKVTPTPTQTPTNTSTPTPTPSVTPTHTPTTTITASATQTPTPTNVLRTTQAVGCHDETSAQGACNCDQGATVFTNGADFASSTLAWADEFGANTGNPEGFYVQDGIVYQVSSSCGVGCITGATITVVGPCGATPTPTSSQTPTPTITPTVTPTDTPQVSPTTTPTNTASVTPTLTQTPTPSSFGSNTFKVTMSNSSRALINGYTLTEVPYISTSGIGFSATTGTFPLSATSSSSSSVYGTHAALNSSTVSFAINSTGSASISILWFVNGSVVSTLNSSVVSGPNTLNLFVAGPYSTSDTIEFRIS